MILPLIMNIPFTMRYIFISHSTYLYLFDTDIKILRYKYTSTMPIKYAEITIIRNWKKESWLSYFKNLIGEEDIITNNDTIIISFDDGTVSDTKSNDANKQFEMGLKHYYNGYPWCKYIDNN